MSSSRTLAAALTMAALAALAPAAAAAQAAPAPRRPPPAVPLPPPPGIPALPPSPAALPREPPLQLVAQLGLDFGFEKLLEVEMSDGSSRSIKANQGINASIGAAFLKLAGGRLATQATIGIEYSGIDASNGSARWLAFPLEVMEVAYVDPLRFGAGISYLLAPSIAGSGFLDSADVDLKNSLGIVLQADWVWRAPGNARGTRLTAGLRFVWQKLEADAGGPAVDANAIGLVAGFTG